jgi:hypothetical protein
MTTEQIVLAILSSSLISGVLGAFIAGRYNLLAKQNEYVNDYYKFVLTKRIAAYEQLENLIVGISTSVLDKDNLPHHIIFTGNDPWPNAFKLLLDVSALWLSDELFAKTRDLNYLFFRGSQYEGGAVEFAKQNYKAIAELREEIERIHHMDMLSLHDVKGFLERKKNNRSGFHEVRLYD